MFCSSSYYGAGSFLLDVGIDCESFNEVWSTYERRKRDRKLKPVLEIHWTTPILHDGHLYAFTGRNEPDAKFRCVELKTGKIKWNPQENCQNQQDFF